MSRDANASHLAQVDLNDSSAESDTAFSRSAAVAGWTGKATASLKCLVPDEMKEEALRAARAAGLSESEWLRIVVAVALRGREEVKRMEQRRVDVVANCFPESGRL